MNEDKSAYEPLSSLSIPTYEAATSSRPPSAQSSSLLGENARDAERQSFLPRGSFPGYHPPTVESLPSSLDIPRRSHDSSGRQSLNELRREISEMEVLEPGDSRVRSVLSKHVSSLRTSLSALQRPFRQYGPSLSAGLSSISRGLNNFKPGWIPVIRFLALIFVLVSVYVLFFTGIIRFRHDERNYFDAERVRQYVQEQINSTRMKESLEHITKFDHVAGTQGSFFIANWLESELRAADLDEVTREQFDVHLNFPRANGRGVAIISPEDKRWQAEVEEESLYHDRRQSLNFQGYSKSGNVTGPLIFINQGDEEDLDRLQNSRINLKGAILLVRFKGITQDFARSVHIAESLGAVGCILYSDPRDNNPGKAVPYPDGPASPMDALRMGSVSYSSWILGDISSAGFASLPNEPKRLKDTNRALPQIPSITLAWRDAETLLQSLVGQGEQLADGDTQLSQRTGWWSGNQQSAVVNLRIEQDEVERQPIYNVLGKISGIEQAEKTVIIGNHYDAWCFGAGSPGSGTAVLLEIVRVFGQLKRAGWRPRRSIVFAAWDGGEYNLIGSTEYVEARPVELKQNAVAYLDIGAAVSGFDFTATGSPLLEKALTRAMKRAPDPSQDRSAYSKWTEAGSRIQGPGLDGDYVAFQDLVGVSSVSLGFRSNDFPKDTCYDTFERMDRWGDPLLEFHQTMGQIWALMILMLADEPLLPYDLRIYANAVRRYVQDLENFVKSKASSNSEKATSIDFSSLYEGATNLSASADVFHEFSDTWSSIYENSGLFETQTTTMERFKHNNRLAAFEKSLLDKDGLPGRSQFKHIIFSPQSWPDGKLAEPFFPSIRDAIEAKNWTVAQKELDKAARILSEASATLLRQP